MKRFTGFRIALVLTLVLAGLSGVARADFSGGAPQLTRAPYLSDLTTSSVRVSWATTTQTRGTVKFGPAGTCTASSVTSTPLGSPITVNGVTEYQNTVTVSGLSPGAAYCYRVYTGDAVPIDLLAGNPSPGFTTLESATSTTPYSFAVFGDWGDSTNSGVNDGTVNTNQSALMANLATSGARFALSTGDVGYQGGTQTNYGDLQQTGVDISSVFGPAYWAGTGQRLPLHGVTGNHGQNAAFLSLWPQSASTAASNGVYDMVSYPSIDGSNPASLPTAYYAFTTGGVRFYVLEASWGNSNVGTATGGPCGSHCAIYQVDHDAHWVPGTAEYNWLAADLAAHPGTLKMAAFHFPLRSDDSTEPDDAYLKWTPGSTGTVEQLLHDNGVKLVFNGHAHLYQRNVAPPAGVISYTTGGGGGKASTLGTCALTDAYAVGWSYSKNKGAKCGSAPTPTDDAQIYHYLKVTVNGSTVTVTPTDSTGATFDAKTYDFGADAADPSAPGSLAFTQPTSTKVALTWTAATDNIGVTAYDIYRNNAYLATVPSGTTSYTDATVIAGTGYDFKVEARDLAGNTKAATVSVNGGGAGDTVAPSTPTGLAATPATTSVGLTWNASADNVGVTAYAVRRNGVVVGTASGTSYTDNGLVPGTAYTYTAAARDAAGNTSADSAPVTSTTLADTSPPTKPGTPTSPAKTPTSISLTWGASTDDVGVLRYDVVRNGTVVGTPTGTSFTDFTVTPGTTYSYVIKAYDAAGNFTASDPLSVMAPPAGSIFYDGFESGDLSAWSPVSGLTVTGSPTHSGAFAARETSTGTVTSAYKTLGGSYTELTAQGWVHVISRTTSVNLFGFRTSSTASIVNVYLDTTARLSLRNNAGGVTTNSTTTVAPGAWHLIRLHAIINGTSSSLDVSLDGTAVPGLTLSGQDLGTSPIAKLQLGETSTGRTYDVALDEITVTGP